MKKEGRTATKKQGKKSADSSLPKKSFNFKLDSPVANGGTRRKSTVESSPTIKFEVSSSISELKEMASSHLESIKRQVERSHSDMLKDVDSTNSRFHKRFKMQAQACQQLMDITDKEFKKLSERITESSEEMKCSYDDFNLEAQTSAARVCKTSIPEKVQSLEKAIDSLRNRYGIFCTPA